MKVVIRYFFRFIRLLLTPIMLISETLSTPKPVKRSEAGQAVVDAACQKLALYQFRACPFCIKVRKEMSRLNLAIEKRDTQSVQAHRDELQAGGGRVKVPCLLIKNEDGSQRWLYESDDIITYLNQQFAAIQ